MKKILLICVNYNSYCALQDFLESVNRAAKAVVKKIQVDVAIIDNTEIGRQKIKTSYEFVNNVSVFIPDTNLGYLGGALLVYNQMSTQYDWVAISNVDLRLQADFFEQLVSIDSSGDIAWLAPDIYTSSTKLHENPYMLQRPTKRNFCVWFLIYSCLPIYYAYYFLHRLKSARKIVVSKTNPTIYAGHGAFMLFTRNFIEHYPSLTYPAYMYGEEIYIAELVRSIHMSVQYRHELHIDNIGHISTNRVAQKIKSTWSKQSLRMIKQRFF